MGGNAERLARIAELQQWKCFYCGITMQTGRRPNGSPYMDSATMDHIHPKQVRKTLPPGERGRCVAACYRCNNQRGDQPLHEFAERKRRWIRRTVMEQRKREQQDRSREGLRRFQRRWGRT